jgi:hypothetical protein
MSNCILDGDIISGAKCIIDYMLCCHNAMTEQKLHELGVVPNIMNEFEIAATLHDARIGISQWRDIVKCLKTYLGLEKIVSLKMHFNSLVIVMERSRLGNGNRRRRLTNAKKK